MHEAIKVDPRSDPNADLEVHQRAVESIARHGRSIGMKTKNNITNTYYEMLTVYVVVLVLFSEHLQSLSSVVATCDSVVHSTAQCMCRYLGRMDAAWVYPRNVIQWTDHMQVCELKGQWHWSWSLDLRGDEI